MTQFAPIVLFVFNRLEHTKKTIESLKTNSLAAESELFVYSDGPRSREDEADVAAVRALIDDLDGFKRITVHKRATNCGLAGSVIAGVTDVIQQYGRAIVIEDDLQFSPYFLNYMNEALDRYEGDQRIFSVGGYSPPLKIPEDYTMDSYLSYRCCTWGWATWQERWDKVDWDIKDFESFINNPKLIERFNRGGDDMSEILKLQMAGKISSWGIRWDYAHFRNDAYCFRPVFSIVGNTGNDGTGVHCGVTDKFDVYLNTQSTFVFPEICQLQINEVINTRFATFYDGKQRDDATLAAFMEKKKGALLKKFVNWLR